MQPKFLYFDLGMVLVNFDVEQMLRQISDVAGVSPEQVRAAMFGRGLMRQHEAGQLSTREFYEAFCSAIGSRPDYDRLVAAAADIFDLNLPMLPIVSQLQQAGYAMGILSNTCETHWKHCLRRFRSVIEGFSVHALSYEIKSLKPEAAIFHRAAEFAQCPPEEIFFVDDIAGHVAGARAVGIDAVQYTSAEALSADLRKRGVRFNW
jgi:putative hydrolase of the HAD superfamily